MQFSLSNTRDVVGHKIDVQVKADQGESIASVRTELDGFSLAHDDLNPPEVQYERIFRHVGRVTPGQNHSLEVTATNDQGMSEVASRRWTDVG
jgi:hypothetical protein